MYGMPQSPFDPRAPLVLPCRTIDMENLNVKEMARKMAREMARKILLQFKLSNFLLVNSIWNSSGMVLGDLSFSPFLFAGIFEVGSVLSK
jgi:hypothetical protein